jgi:hypothetical protein
LGGHENTEESPQEKEWQEGFGEWKKEFGEEPVEETKEGGATPALMKILAARQAERDKDDKGTPMPPEAIGEYLSHRRTVAREKIEAEDASEESPGADDHGQQYQGEVETMFPPDSGNMSQTNGPHTPSITNTSRRTDEVQTTPVDGRTATKTSHSHESHKTSHEPNTPSDVYTAVPLTDDKRSVPTEQFVSSLARNNKDQHGTAHKTLSSIDRSIEDGRSVTSQVTRITAKPDPSTGAKEDQDSCNFARVLHKFSETLSNNVRARLIYEFDKDVELGHIMFSIFEEDDVYHDELVDVLDLLREQCGIITVSDAITRAGTTFNSRVFWGDYHNLIPGPTKWIVFAVANLPDLIRSTDSSRRP